MAQYAELHDGTRLEFPDETAPEVIQATVKRMMQQAQPEKSWGSVASDAVSNIPSSIGNMIGGIAQTIRHPLDTAENLGKLGFAGAVKALPQGAEDWMVKHAHDPEKFKNSLGMAEKVGEFYGDRYGSKEGFKNALSTDPAGVMADAATVLTGGGALVSKLGTANKLSALSKPGQYLSMAGKAVDPLALALKGVKTGINAAKWGAGKGVGLMTGTGDTMSELYRAGAKSSSAADSAIQNMRGNVPKTDVLLDLQDNITQMKRNRMKDYQMNMATTRANTKPLDYADIDSAINNAESSVINTKGFVKNQKAVDLINDIKETVAQAKEKGMNTAEEFDDLKQAINAVNEKYGYENPSATRIGTQIYGSVKNTIVKQSQEYAKAMKSYEEASDVLDDIKKTLSQSPNASVDTQMRKLQSLMRNDVNTNYGNRLDLVKELERQGGREILPALAGQSANTWLPRGLSKAVAGGTAAGGVMTLNPMAVPVLAASSPRLMGEAAVKAGQLARALKKGGDAAGKATSGIDPRILANALYQANQPKE